MFTFWPSQTCNSVFENLSSRFWRTKKQISERSTLKQDIFMTFHNYIDIFIVNVAYTKIITAEKKLGGTPGRTDTNFWGVYLTLETFRIKIARKWSRQF